MQRRSFFNSALATSKARAAKTGGDIPMRTFGKTGVKLTVVG